MAFSTVSVLRRFWCTVSVFISVCTQHVHDAANSCIRSMSSAAMRSIGRARSCSLCTRRACSLVASTIRCIRPGVIPSVVVVSSGVRLSPKTTQNMSSESRWRRPIATGPPASPSQNVATLASPSHSRVNGCLAVNFMLTASTCLRSASHARCPAICCPWWKHLLPSEHQEGS